MARETGKWGPMDDFFLHIKMRRNNKPFNPFAQILNSFQFKVKT